VHEFSLAGSIIQTVAQSARERGITRVVRVTVVVGEWAAVLPDALQAGFAILAADAGPPVAGADLVVEVAPAEAECTACGDRFAVATSGLKCPACSQTGRLVAGLELSIDSYEGE